MKANNRSIHKGALAAAALLGIALCGCDVQNVTEEPAQEDAATTSGGGTTTSTPFGSSSTAGSDDSSASDDSPDSNTSGIPDVPGSGEDTTDTGDTPSKGCNPLPDDGGEFECDPEICVPSPLEFSCELDASGCPGVACIGVGMPCDFDNGCEAGSFCDRGGLVDFPDCTATGGVGCCTEFCSLDDKDACEGNGECEAWPYGGGAPADLGFCTEFSEESESDTSSSYEECAQCFEGTCQDAIDACEDIPLCGGALSCMLTCIESGSTINDCMEPCGVPINGPGMNDANLAITDLISCTCGTCNSDCDGVCA